MYATIENLQNIEEPKTEKELQKAVIAYIRRNIKPKFVGLRIIVNPWAGVRMSKNKMSEAKALGFEPSQPDIMIPFEMYLNTGLAIELKKQGVTVWNKNGTLRESKHIKEQFECLQDLAIQGYAANFAVGYKEAINQINKYFNI